MILIVILAPPTLGARGPSYATVKGRTQSVHLSEVETQPRLVAVVGHLRCPTRDLLLNLFVLYSIRPMWRE